jgi:hypothetical protein
MAGTTANRRIARLFLKNRKTPGRNSGTLQAMEQLIRVNAETRIFAVKTDVRHMTAVPVKG